MWVSEHRCRATRGLIQEFAAIFLSLGFSPMSGPERLTRIVSMVAGPSASLSVVREYNCVNPEDVRDLLEMSSCLDVCKAESASESP